MKSGLKPFGFTIVEVMIFLAVSGALMLAAMTAISGSQNKAEFNVAINDAQQQIETIASNVATGYYASSENVTCVNPVGSVLNISTSGGNRGSNKDCAFIGRVFDFDMSTSTMRLYSVAGARMNPDGSEVTRMLDSKSTVIDATPENYRLKNGLRIRTLKENGSPVQAIGFFSTFGKTSQVSGTDQLVSTSQQYDFIGIQGAGSVPTLISDNSFRSTYGSKINPPNGIELCFESSGTNQHGVLKIGGLSGSTGRSATTSLTVNGGTCPL